MKYRLLTQEQFESLHLEFSQFLASQEIDAEEWSKIKKENSELVQKELELFSDMVWEDVLTRITHIDHYSNHSINLFHCEKDKVSRIVVQTSNDVDLLSKPGYEWLLENPLDDSIEYFTGNKPYGQDRNLEIFTLIEQGGQVSKGELFTYFQRLVNS